MHELGILEIVAGSPQAEEPLRSSNRTVKGDDWDTPAKVKARFSKANIVGGNRVVFNIRGNEYRLIVEINYRYQTAYARFMGTHAEYNRIDAREGVAMVKVKPIRTEADYEAALARAAALMDARESTPEGAELDVLVDLVEVYEDRHFPMGYPDSVAAIEF